MNTIAWLSILTGALLIRQVAKGRVKETPSDMSDLFVALVTGNLGDIRATFNQPGQSGLVLTPSDLTQTTATTGDAVGGGVGTLAGGVLLGEVQKLGKAATGYTWGAVGPTRYDCSGIVWRAMRNMGYKGARFTTFTFDAVGRKYGIRVASPKVGDVVVWNKGGKGHMGVVSGPNQMYAARSTNTGIGFQSLSGPTSDLGPPRIYRLNNIS